MKVSIIGGGGLVGSCTGFALQAGAVVREIALLDANQEAAEGQALDLLHGAALCADQVITAGGYEHIPTSDCICITAGLRRKPDESRLDLINRNVDLFVTILQQIREVGYKPTAKVLVVSNPVDILTYLAARLLDLPTHQVLGLGTQLDTLRFRSLIAQRIGASPTQVSALILGEHGDSMVPIWSSASVGGLPLRGGSDQEEGRRRICRRGGNRRSDRSDGPGPPRLAAGFQRAARLLRHPRCGPERADGRRRRGRRRHTRV